MFLTIGLRLGFRGVRSISREFSRYDSLLGYSRRLEWGLLMFGWK